MLAAVGEQDERDSPHLFATTHAHQASGPLGSLFVATQSHWSEAWISMTRCRYCSGSLENTKYLSDLLGRAGGLVTERRQPSGCDAVVWDVLAA